MTAREDEQHDINCAIRINSWSLQLPSDCDCYLSVQADEQTCECGHSFEDYHRTPGAECSVQNCECVTFRLADERTAARLAETRLIRHVLSNCECRTAQQGFDALKDVYALEERLQRVTDALREIADTSFFGNYDDAAIIRIYREWANNALSGSGDAT